MIVLGKDKVDERYNIDDNGIITDLQGNVQETKIYQGRPAFKGIAVHRILMYTKFGYKDLDIHHLDENPLNNNINNLVFLTRSEHRKLHMIGNKLRIGMKHTKEWKSIKSNSMLGENHFNYGKKLSEETKMKIRKALQGHHHSEDTKRKMAESRKKYLKKL